MVAPAHADSGLLVALRALMHAQPRALIGIDGKDGSGKSYLCDQVSAELNLPAVHLDDFVERHKGGYLEHMQLDQLASAISGRTAAILVEGVCLLQVLARVGVRPDFLIYVKRMSAHGWWQDEGDCDFPGSFSEFQRQHFRQGLGALPALEVEVLSYHLAHRPHNAANHVCYRVEH